ncbi:MAG: arginine--tRNA ligase [Candidatus Brocadiae bacterium]|nr:arginine--tRNA ligase [Candidatus Brocadiia bacterium]
MAEAVATAFGEADLSALDIRLVETPNPEVGDLGFGCFPLAKLLRRSPKDIAAALAAAIELPAPFREARGVGPYLNLWLDRPAFLAALCRDVLDGERPYGTRPPGELGRIVLEFSSPNTNKPQHLGHIRNNVLGMALARLLEAAGHEVVKVTLVNDRGVHICKSMLAYQRWGDGATPESTGTKGDHFVGDYYVKFCQEAAADESLEEQAKEMLRRWEQGDEEVMALWRTMNGWVERGFDETYRRLGVAFDRVYHESETYRFGRDIALAALGQGHCQRLPDGAVEIDLTADGLDKKILLRRDGTSVYMTQDLGTAVRRFEEWQPEAMFYVVGSEQIYHFKVLFLVLQRFGYAWAEQCRHISYGMVHLPEGKMKSREGKVVDADDLMTEVEAISGQAIREKHPDISADELAARQHEIALGAIKFFLLNVNLEKDITFDPAASVSFEGDTGPYIQYAHTRICGILRKAGPAAGTIASQTRRQPLSPLPRCNANPPHAVPVADFAQLGSDDEVALGRLLMEFPKVVAEAARTRNPARIAGHVLDVARSFTTFYHGHPVIQAASPGLGAARLALCRATAAVLKQGLALLGIEAPEQM